MRILNNIEAETLFAYFDSAECCVKINEFCKKRGLLPLIFQTFQKLMN